MRYPVSLTFLLFLLLPASSLAHHAPPDPHPLPAAQVTFSPASPNPGQAVSFDGAGSSCPIRPCWYQWKVDGQVVSDGLPQTLTRTFTAGQHTVSLEVVDHWWAADTKTVTVNVATPPPAPVELARGKPVTASSSYPGFPAGNANDGNTGTRWSSQFAASGEWWRVDLGALASISSVEVDWENATASPYTIQVSTDGVAWSNAATQVIGIDVTAVSTTFRTDFPAVQGRYVRILQGGRGPGNCCYGMSFWEARVYGATGAPPPPPPPPPPPGGSEGDIRPSGVFDSGADGTVLAAVNGDTSAQNYFRHYERARVYQDANWPAVQAYAQNNTWMPKGWTYRDAMVASYAPGMTTPSFHLRDQAGNPLYINFACGGGACTQWAADIGNPAWRASYVDGLRTHAAESQGVFMDDANFYLPQVVSNGSGQFVRPWNPRTNALMTDSEWAGYMLQLVRDVKAAFPDPIEVVLNTIAWHGPGILNIPEAKAAFAVADGWEIEGVTVGQDVSGYQTLIDYIHSQGAFVVHDLGSPDATYSAAIYLCFNAGKDFIGHGSMNPNQAWPALWDRNLGNATSACVKGSDGIFRRSFTNGSVTANPATKAGTVVAAAPAWSGDFETGDYSQWWLHQWSGAHRDPGQGYTNTNVGNSDLIVGQAAAQPVKQGTYSGKFEVYPHTGPSANDRAEAVATQAQSGGVPGQEWWYGWWTLFPGPPQDWWKLGADWNAVVQFTSTDVSGNSFGMNVDATKTPPNLQVDVLGQPGHTVVGALQYDHWYHTVVHAKWSTGADGVMQVWVGDRQLVDRTGPTLEAQSSPCCGFTAPGMFLSIGMYRGAHTSKNTVIHDGFSRGASRQAVE